MSRDWTPEELQAASQAMKAAGHMGYEEFCEELESVKTWDVTYKHPITGEKLKTVVFAKNLKEAREKAFADNTPTQGNSFYWEIDSVEERTA